MPPVPNLTWRQAAGTYDGEYTNAFIGGQDLLEYAEPRWRNADETATSAGRLATALNIATVVLAAAAGVTVLPKDISIYVSATIAFVAAVVAGLNIVLDPEKKSVRAMLAAAQWVQLRKNIDEYMRWIPQDAHAAAEQGISTGEIDRRLAGLRETSGFIAGQDSNA